MADRAGLHHRGKRPLKCGNALGREEGFTLLEVLVAFAIMALMLGALLQVFSEGFRRTEIGENHATAVLLAQSKLASLETIDGLSIGQSSGEFENGFRWQVDVQPLEGAKEPSPGALVEPVEVVLTVAWGDEDGSPQNNKESRVVLRSVRLAVIDDFARFQ